MAQSHPPAAMDDLETVRAILVAAARMVGEHTAHAGDPLRGRWDRAFSRMPAEDRETVVAAVEQEIDLRVLTAGEGESIAGLSGLRPNPGARLYLRVFDGDLPRLQRDEIMLATLRAARLMLGTGAPDADVFGDGVRAAFRALSPEERIAIARHNRTMLRLLAECDPDVSASPPAK